MQEKLDSYRRPSVTQVSILFSITILLFLSIGYRAQYREFYSGIIITEFGLIMLPALVFLLIFRFDLKSVLRLNKASFLSFFTVFWLMAFAIPIAGVFNFLNLWAVNSIFGKVVVKQPPAASNLPELLINVLVIGGAAGLCEEFLFRGVIQRGFERFGAAKAILGAAILFSLTHLDFQKVLGTFVLGALIGFIVYRSNSLFSGMLAHFTNNSLAVVISYIVLKLMELFKQAGFAGSSSSQDINSLFSTFSKMPKEQLVMVIFIYGFIFLIFVSAFIALLYAFLQLNPARKSEAGMVIAQPPAIDNAEVLSSPQERVTGKKGRPKWLGVLWVIPGISMIGLMYFVEISTFRGINPGFIETIRRLLGVF